DPREAAGAAVARGAGEDAAARGSRPHHRVHRRLAAPRVRERGDHQPDLESVHPRRPGSADALIIFRVVLPFLAGYYLSYVFRAVNAVLGPTLAQEFGLNATELGFLTGVYFFSFGLFQIPLGLLLDRFGPRRVNGALLVLAAGGGVAFAQAQSFEALVLARALIGLGVSACLMGSIQAFVLWFPPERTATMIALAYSMGGLGAMTASFPLEAALGGRSPLPLFVGGVGGALAMLALLALGVTSGAVLLWAAFVFFGTGATLAHSIATRRYPREMAGRVNTTLNSFTFLGAFLGQ